MTDPTLSDDDMQDVHSLVLACLDAADPERELERRTADQPQLRATVRQIMARARGGEGATHSETTIPDKIGPFHIVRQLGAGGMGAVYLAEQHEPIARTVALKLVKLGMDTDEVLRRFEFERQTLALMNHDNIARVHDAGKTARGQPYFAMEYVPGTPITKFADAHSLGIEARLKLVLEVCVGVQHAHQRGVVHRDLKPANILVVERDGRGVPKIIDFGLARAIEQHRHDVTELTMAGTILGTPAYMSPEQTGLTDEAVDTRSDVYALGVILYELLTGELPFSADELLSGGPEEMRRLICDVEPPRPSRKLLLPGIDIDAVAQRRATTPTVLLRALQRDLDWIVMLALRKEREQRYASVGELAADIQRYLDDEPVSATAPSTLYRVRKLLKRYRVQAIAAALVLACLVGGLVVSLVFFFAARHAQVETQFAKDRLDPLILRALEQEAKNELWPVHPDLVPRMERWLERADQLRQRDDAHRVYLVGLEEQLARDKSAGTTANLALAEILREHRRLIDDLRQFLDPGPTDANVAGVAARLEAARTLRQRTIEAHRHAWADARTAIAASDGVRASTLYAGLDLPPQLGLIPLGMDPASKLWEFYDPDAGDADALPARDANGRVAMRQEYGFVFVLVPGGTFTMGADKEHDGDDAEADEGPRHEVTLAPFLLSKYECTQAQWRRLTGETPSHYGFGYAMPAGVAAISWTNPVESVLSDDVMTVCSRHNLNLPTEAQWEYACRGMTTTRYAFGNDTTDLELYENIADAFAASKAHGWQGFEEWSDGHVVHAPAGTFRPNPFGLHDMHGNVAEMCRDLRLPYTNPVRAGDGLRLGPTPAPTPPPPGIGRGGSWMWTSLRARCADRQEVPQAAVTDLIGFRPARRVQPGSE